MANQIKFRVGYEVDKNGLNEIKSSLQAIQKLTSSDLMSLNKGMDLATANQELVKIKQTASQVQSALSRSFNSDLGTLNISKFNSELKNLDINRIYNDFNNAGAAGQSAFRNITSQILTTNMQLKQTHNLLDEMATTMSNTIKWGIASSVMNSFSNNVQQAFNYVEKLDSSLNDIRIVTGKSADEMSRFAENANKTAKELSASTRDITEGALIYYQQGDTDEDALAKAEITQKAANVSQISAEDASEYLTAVWNGYQVANEAAQEGIQVYEEYVDKLAAVAAGTASDLEESSIAMSKVASSANAMGVDFDQLNAQIATIISVTRQAPESVGTALKTIYARMGDLAIDGEDEFGTTLGDVSGKMKQMGIDVVDETGNLRDMGTVIEEVAAKWDTWTEAQRQAAAVAMAGKRQYNNLIALFDNWDMYTDSLNMSKDALGTLQEQQDTYAERTAAHIQNMKTSFEDLYDSILDEGSINNVVDLIGDAAGGMATLVDSIGGGGNALLGLGSIATKVFSKQIAQGISTTITNFKNAKSNAEQFAQELEIIKQYSQSEAMNDKAVQAMVEAKKATQEYYSVLNAEQINESNALIKELGSAKDLEEQWIANKEAALDYTQRLMVDESLNFEDLDPGTSSAYESIAFNLDQARNSVEKADIATKNMIKTIQTYETEVEDVDNNWGTVYDAIGKCVEQAKELSTRTDVSTENLKRAINELNWDNLDIDNVSDILQSDFSGVEGQQLEQKIYNLKTAMSETTKDISNKVSNTTNVINNEFSKTISKSDELSQKVKQASDSFENFNNQAKQVGNIETFVKTTSAIGQMTFAFQSFLNLWDIWENEDLSMEEKLLQSFTDLSMIIPSVVTSAGTLKTAFVGLAVQTGLVSAEVTTLSGVFSALLANPVALTIIGITGAVTAAVVAFDAFTVSAKEAEENLNDSVSRYTESKNELSELENELKTTKDRLEELYSIADKDLTIADKKEIANLQAENAELKTQYNLKKKIKESDQQDVIKDAKKAAEKEAYDVKLGTTSSGMDTISSLRNQSDYRKFNYAMEDGRIASAELSEDIKDISITDIESYEQWEKEITSEIKRIKGLIKEYEKSGDETAETAYKNLLNDLTSLKNGFTKAWDESTKEALTSAKDNVSVWQESLDALMTDPEKNEKYIEYYQDKIKEYYKLAGTYEETVAEAFSNAAKDSNSLKDLFEEDNLNNLFADGELNEDFIKNIIGSDSFNQLKEQADSLGLSLEDMFEAIKNGDIGFQDLADAAKEAAGEISETKTTVDQLKETSELKSGIDSLFDKYEENEGYLSEDEVASILQENPEYMEYIIKVGDQYKLNEEALNDWNRASKEQQELIDTMLGSFDYLSNYEDLLTSIQSDSSHGEDALGVGGAGEDQSQRIDSLLEKNKELNSSLEEGSISVQEYFNGISESISNSGIEEALSNLNGEFDETTDYLEETVSVLATELSDALIQSNKQFLKGEISVGDYLDILDASADAQKKLLKSTYSLTEGADGQVKAVNDQSEAAQSAAEAYNEMTSAQEGLSSASILADMLEENAAYLSQYTDEAGNLMDSLLDDSRFTSFTESLSNALVRFAQDSTENMNLAAAQLSAVTGISLNEAKVMLDGNAAAVQGAMGNSLSAIQGMTNFAMQNVSGSITNASSAIGNVLSSLGNAISNFEFHIKAEPYVTGGFGLHRDKDGMIDGISLPPFGYDITGSGGGSVQSFATALSKAGEYFSNAGASQAASEALDINSYLPSGTSPSSRPSSYRPSYGGGSGGGGGNGGSGGGGSGEKEADPEHIDELEDEADRYHDINLEIEDLTNQLDKLENQQEKLMGKELLDNLEEQLEVLEKQKEAYKDKIELAKMEANELKSSLSAQGVKFDEDGYISNYSSALQAKLNYVNSLIRKYNNMSAAEQEGFKDTVEKAKEDYEDFKSAIEDYDDLISNTIPDLEEDIQDAIDKQIEIQIEKFTMTVDLRIDMAEAERDFNEFKRKVIDEIKDDDILGNALSKLEDFSSYYKDGGEGVIETLTKQLNDTMDQITQINETGFSDVYGDNKVQAMEDLKEYYEELMTQLEDVQELVDEINESYLDMIDEAKDKFDEQVDQYEYISDLIDHNMNVISLLYGEDAYSQLSKYYEAQEQNNNKQLDFYKQQANFWKERMDAEEEGSEAWEKYRENWEDAVNGLNDTVANSIENLINKYQNAINQIFDDLNNKLTNNKGLDYISEEWDLINQNADQYLDSINSMYEIQKLENKYLDAIDSTDSISAQNKLNDLMSQQLEMLKDKEKLTQYDVDRANTLYEIALKEIALEDAQQNKSKMRLRRDSQGNYTYQYVSDEDSIAQAQQELADAQNSLYNLDKDKYQSNLDDIYNIYSEFQQKLLELYSDQTLADEEREEKKKLLVEQYGELINNLVEQNEEIRLNLQESAFQELANMYDVDVSNFLNMSEQEKDILMNNIIPQWDSGIQQMIDKFAGEGGFIPTCEEAFEKLEEATKDYESSLDDLEDSAGINFDTIASGYENNIDLAQDLISANDELINKYNEQLNAIQSVISQVNELIAKYTQAKNEAIAATEAAYKYWQQESANAALEGSQSGSGGSGGSSGSGGGSSSGSGSGGGSSKGDGVPKVGDVVTYTGGTYYYDSYGTSPSGNRGPGKKVTITYMNKGAPYPIHVESSDSAYGWLKQSQISGFETGGYTGEWSNTNGKLAVLHEKELVLNKDDTKNLLSSVGIVRDMDNILKSINLSVMNKVFDLLSGISSIDETKKLNTEKDMTIDQKVQINANFPNASKASEIEEAFNNLINTASQYAYRTKK